MYEISDSVSLQLCRNAWTRAPCLVRDFGLLSKPMDMPLDVYLSRELKRRVLNKEVQEALGMKRSTYNDRKRDGFSMNEVVAACMAFDVSPVLGLVELGFISKEEVILAAEALGVNVTAKDAEALMRIKIRREQRDTERGNVVPLGGKAAPAREPKPWDNAPTYDPNEEIDFSTYDAAHHGPKEQIPDWEGDYS